MCGIIRETGGLSTTIFGAGGQLLHPTRTAVAALGTIVAEFRLEFLTVMTILADFVIEKRGFIPATSTTPLTPFIAQANNRRVETFSTNHLEVHFHFKDFRPSESRAAVSTLY
jgi:hypothetical protein